MNEYVFDTITFSEELPRPKQKALKVPEQAQAIFPVVYVVPWHLGTLDSNMHQGVICDDIMNLCTSCENLLSVNFKF
jgi:hypothetical protein